MSTTANSAGAYTVSVANGTYTVTPTLNGFTFNPSSQTITVNNAAITVTSFTSTITVPADSKSIVGSWTMLTQTMPLNPIHVSLLHTNQVLVVDGSGNCPPGQAGCPAQNVYPAGAGVLNLTDFSTDLIDINWDMFCNNMTQLADGRVLIQGGNAAYGALTPVNGGGNTVTPFKGLANTSIFDPSSLSFTDFAPTAHGRWYPTTTLTGDGRVVTMDGLNENGAPNNTSETYDAGLNTWSTPVDPDNDTGFVIPGEPACGTSSFKCFVMSLYPRNLLLPNGSIFYSGPDTATAEYNPSTEKWSFVAWGQFPGGERTYGSNVLLPMTPANNWNPTVFIVGGDNPATNSTELLDLVNNVDGCGICWVAGPNMIQPRVESQATLLPNGEVLVDAGSATDEDATTASLKAELFDPNTKTFKSAGVNAKARLYHNTQLLLPDGSVLLMGGNPAQGVYEQAVEIYKPPYFYSADGSLAIRPTITSAATTAAYGATFTITTPDAANIGTVVLMKAGSDTHSFDNAQRHVGLAFAVSGSTLTATVNNNSNLLPLGYYMLFVVSKTGVPSVASWVQIYGTPTSVTNVARAVSQFIPTYVGARVARMKSIHPLETPLPNMKEMHIHAKQ